MSTELQNHSAPKPKLANVNVNDDKKPGTTFHTEAAGHDEIENAQNWKSILEAAIARWKGPSRIPHSQDSRQNGTFQMSEHPTMKGYFVSDCYSASTVE